ncbi:MAG: hypothetical protein ACREPF_07085 [Rhodanobacteraceae bacterium]
MATHAATAKLSILVTPAVKRRLEGEARAKKTTVGDLVRRRLDGEPSEEERLFLEALADWGKHAEAVLSRVDATHAKLARERAAWSKREAAIRKATLAGLDERDRAALAALLPAIPQATRGSRR